MLHTFHRVEGSLNWQSANSLSFFIALKYLPDTDNCFQQYTSSTIFYIYNNGQKKKLKNLPSSHFSPLHCGLHEQAKASFSLSNKQEPPLRHPAIRQPCRKLHFNYFSKRYSFLKL